MISKYGDTDSVKNDVKTLNEMISRQGITLVIDVIAEHAGGTAIKFGLNDIERDRLLHSLYTELKEALSELL